MKNTLKVIEIMMILFGAVLFGVPVASLIAAPMALANLVCAGYGRCFRRHGNFYYKNNQLKCVDL